MRTRALRTAWVIAALLMLSCGSTVRSESEAAFAIKAPPPTTQPFSGLVVYSDIFGGRLPPRAAGIRAGRRVVLSFVACERRSVDYGAPSWSCRPDDSEATPEERAVIERSAACFRLERRDASRAISAALEADRPRALGPTNETHLVFVRRTQVNRNTERLAVGCEGATPGQPCDPIGSRTTGRTLEQVTRSRHVWIGGEGAPADPNVVDWLEVWPFPAWRANVAYATIDTPEGRFAPGDTLADDDARQWLDRLSQIDASTAPRAMRLALLWDRAVLSFKVADRAHAEPALVAVEQELGAASSPGPIEEQITYQAPTLHALLDGTLSLSDPCRRP